MEGVTRFRSYMLLVLVCAVAPFAGCAGAVGTTSASMIRKVKESPDPNIRYLAYAKLASPRVYDDEAQKAEAATLLAANLTDGNEPEASRVVLCHTLGELKRPEARSAILRVIGDPSSPAVRAAACRALGKVGQPEDALILAKVMTMESDADCRIAAIEALGTLKSPDPRIDAVLVDGMESTDPAIRLASLQSLRATSGQDLGLEPEPWRKYADQRAKTLAVSTPPVQR